MNQDVHAVRAVAADAVRAALPYDRLIDALRRAFAVGAEVPLRHHHAVTDTATLLLMPAWQADGLMGVKIVSVFPGNAARGTPALSSSYLLCDAVTGRHLALMDGTEITGRRTAATAALGADYLARPDASRLLVVGAGHIAGEVPHAMRAVRSIAAVAVWDIAPERAADLAERLRAQGFDAAAATDLERATGEADVVSCATLASAPLIRGAWLRPGTHLDLIGSFRPDMRETDDEAMAHARVVADGPAAIEESGDLIGPLRSGALAPDRVAFLAALCRGETPGRADSGEVTVFKAVGTALADLAAAALVHDATRDGRLPRPA